MFNHQAPPVLQIGMIISVDIANAAVAQLAERPMFNREVGGSGASAGCGCTCDQYRMAKASPRMRVCVLYRMVRAGMEPRREAHRPKACMSVIRSRPGSARFCPFCGVANIERDVYHKTPSSAVDWICNVCHAGWRMATSPRVQASAALHSEHRAMRVGKS